jgi:hypothetical protein
MERTRVEDTDLNSIRGRIDNLTTFLNGHGVPRLEASLLDWYSYLLDMKHIVGSLDNFVSFVACLMAKDHLLQKSNVQSFEVALRAQNAPGPDIQTMTVDGKIIQGEVKTTIPCNGPYFGGNQEKSVKRDFEKLRKYDAHHKYLFVTNENTFQLLKNKYAKYLANVTVVQLLTGEEHLVQGPSVASR